MSYIDKSNKKSIVSFFLKSYEIDINNKKSIPQEIVEFDMGYNSSLNNFETIFYPFYQRLGWGNSVIDEELIIKWVKNKELMQIIIKPSTYKKVALLNPPHIKISFKKGLFEITDLEKSTCCD